MLKAGDTLLNGQYRILRQLGRGGFGYVYHARHTHLREEVATEELIPGLVGEEQMLRRFIDEARATLRLRHERIVGTQDLGQERDNYYIIRENMPGGSLEDRLKSEGPLPQPEALRVPARCARAWIMPTSRVSSIVTPCFVSTKENPAAQGRSTYRAIPESATPLLPPPANLQPKPNPCIITCCESDQ